MGCYIDDTELLQGISAVYQGFYRVVADLLKGFIKWLQECYRDFTQVLQGSYLVDKTVFYVYIR